MLKVEASRFKGIKTMIQKTLFLCASVLLFSSAAFAIEPVYVVDMQKVISESIAGKAAKNDIEAELKKREGALSKTQNDLKAMKAELDSQSSVLSKEALKAKQEALILKDKEFQKTYQENREALAKKNNDSIGKIVTEIDAIVKKIAKDKEYRLVLEKDQRVVLYVADEYDITDAVLKQLNDKKLDL